MLNVKTLQVPLIGVPGIRGNEREKKSQKFKVGQLGFKVWPKNADTNLWKKKNIEKYIRRSYLGERMRITQMTQYH